MDRVVDALAAGFLDDSILFKFISHDIHRLLSFTSGFPTRRKAAFVFGQLLSPYSVSALVEVSRNSKKSDMVQHEVVEALGGVGTPEVFPRKCGWRETVPFTSFGRVVK